MRFGDITAAVVGCALAWLIVEFITRSATR